jgi:hypothetical protein
VSDLAPRSPAVDPNVQKLVPGSPPSGAAGGGAAPTPAAGPAPGNGNGNPILTEIAPAPDHGAANVAALANALAAEAKAFFGAIYDPWYDVGVSCLNVGAIAVLAASYAQRWTALKEKEARLQLLPMQPSDAAAVHEAAQEVDNVRRQFGNLGLQEFLRQPVLGHYSVVDPGPDPLPFLSHWSARTQAAIASACQILALCRGATNGALDADQAGKVAALLGAHASEPMEVKWLHQVIVANDFLKLIDQASLAAPPAPAQPSVFGMVPDAPKGESLQTILAKESAHADDQLSLTRDGQSPVSPEKQQQMFHDADAINDEVTSLVLVDSVKIHDILARYPPKERAEFFRVLERRNLLANMVHRYESLLGVEPLMQLIHETPGYESWKYDSNLATARGLGEQAVYIAEEAARQLPGALCSFAAGVFRGLSALPIIGGLFGDLADGSMKLGHALDKVTGASDIGRDMRDLVANTTGVVFEKLGEVAVTGRFAGVSAVNNVNSAIKLGGAAYDTYQTVMELKRAVDIAKHEWPILASAVPEAFQAVKALTSDSNDPDYKLKALQHLSKCFDDVMGGLAEQGKATYTAEGQKEDKEKAEKLSPEGHDAEQKNDVAAAARGLPAGTKEAVQRLHAAHEEMLAAKSLPEQAVAQAKLTQAADELKGLFGVSGAAVLGAKQDMAHEKEAAEKDEEQKKRAAAGEAEPSKLEVVGQHVLDTLIETGIEVLKSVLIKLKEVAVARLTELIAAGEHKEAAKKSLGEELGEAFKKGLAEGVVDVAVEKLGNVINGELGKLIAEGLSKYVFHVDMTAELKPAIKELLEYAEKELKLKEKLSEQIEHGIGALLGEKEEGAGEGKPEGAAEPAAA